jgi:hypothetical protein
MPLELKEVMELLGIQKRESHSHSFELGKQYLIRCVTHYYLGRLCSVTDTDLVLDDASWIADTGRFYDALSKGTLNECEPFISPVIISRMSIVDATEWKHKLLRDQK